MLSWILLAVAIVGSIVPIVAISIMRGRIRAKMVEDAVREAETSSVKKPVAPAPAARASSVAPAAASGAGFGRVHVGVFTQRDPAFSELAFMESLDGLYRRVQADKRADHPATEGALATMRAGRFTDREITQVIPGRLDLKGAYGDELWSNVEVLFQSIVVEAEGPTHRKDLWRLRRRQHGPWELGTVSEWNRYEAIPQPETLPYGDVGPGVLAAVDLDRQWSVLGAGVDLGQLQLRANDLLRSVLRGVVFPGPLARFADVDAFLLAHHGRERTVDIERIEVRSPIRCSRDAENDLVEFQALVWMRSWLSPVGEPLDGPVEAACTACAFTMVRAGDGESWTAYDLRWTAPSES
ncbi:MAG: hypothetical protein GY913_06315 [Proteobacteria bacterium]|nr:hypothetical protein [Pseudomonadota bacterium]MCP4916521.1 hypothetical protein [Pseudomonadota bacterium]